MYYKKEHAAISVLGVFLGIFFTFTLSASLLLFPLQQKLKDVTDIKSYITDDAIIDDLSDEINDELKQRVIASDVSFDTSKDIFSDEYLKEFLTETFDYAFSGKEADVDALADGFKDELKNYIKASGLNYDDYAADIDKASDDFKNEYDKLIKELSTENDTEALGAELKSFNDGFLVITIVCGVISLALALIILLIYKKKYRATLNIGICSTVAGAMSFLMSFAFSAFVALIMSEIEAQSSSDISSNAIAENLFNILSDKLASLPAILMITSLLALVIGIIMIVFSAITGSNYKKSCMTNPGTYSNPNDYNYNGPEF